MVHCHRCGGQVTEHAHFCAQCGAALASSGVELERRHVTVVFSDVVGYTTISERLDAEEVRDITNEIFEAAARVVRGYGGRVDKLLGDAVLIVFGDPVAHEDDPERAVR